MNIVTWLDRIPLPVLFLLMLVLVFLAIAGGMRLGAVLKERSKGSESIGSVVGGTLGLVAFLLAFTFNMTANRFNERKLLLLDEVNAIETAYLRAGLLPPAYAADVRSRLREYVDLRAQVVRQPETILEVIAKCENVHEQLWSSMEELNADQPVSVAQSLFIQSLNEVIDLHRKRVTVGLHYRIPGTIWLGLFVVSALAMITVGYQFGHSGQRHITMNLVMALAFTAVIMLIADLDRAAEGTVRIDPQPLYDLQENLNASR